MKFSIKIVRVLIEVVFKILRVCNFCTDTFNMLFYMFSNLFLCAKNDMTFNLLHNTAMGLIG